MAHKTLIGGTAYEISGGKTLIDSTAYEIDKGKTLVDGTAYELGFNDDMRTITVTLLNGKDYAEACYYRPDMPDYSYPLSPGQNIVPVGTVLNCRVKSLFNVESYIYVNGIVVASTTSQSGVSYDFTITRDITLSIDAVNGGGGEIRIIELYDNGAILTISTNGPPNYTSCAEITIEGYGTYVANTTATYELVVPFGTKIECTVRKTSGPASTIVVNKINVADTTTNGNPTSYTYIVNSNATVITVNTYIMGMYGRIEITDANYIPEE